ncbi:MAG: HNH endonuclease [Methyloversatilis sp.]|nr:HNH endonuclease [Methyloversatilis sp.]
MEFVLFIVAIIAILWAWQGMVECTQHLARRLFPQNEDVISYAPYIFTDSIVIIAAVIAEPIGVKWQWSALCSVLAASLFGHARIRQKRDADRQEELRRANRAREIYSQYESNPYLINDPNFRDEFFRVGAASHSWNLKESARTEGWTVYGRATGWKCQGCGKMIYDRRQAHVDHIKPKSKYPHLAYLRSNLQILCARCNSHKGAYDGDDWREEIKLRKKKKAVQRRKKTLKERREQNASG